MSRKRSESLQSVATSLNSSKDDVPLYYCDRNFFSKLPNTTRKAEGTLYITTVLTVLFITAEIIGGYLANSLAVITDAGHMVSDLVGFVFSLIAIRLARRKPTKQFSFGFHRAEVIGAVISIILIWALTAVLVYMAIMRIVNNDYDVDANIMLITASVGILFNIVMGLVLHFGKGASHSHFGTFGADHHENGRSDAENQDYSRSLETVNEAQHDPNNNNTSKLKSRSKTNINIRAAFIHVVGDFVQSVGVLTAAAVIKFTGWKYADPICTFVFSVLVLITTLSVMRDAILILMEAAPRNFDVSGVNTDLCSIEGVRDVHSLRIWSLTPDKTAISVHLDIEDGWDSNHVVHEANERLRKKYGIFYITVQVQCVCSKSVSMQTILTTAAAATTFDSNTETVLDKV